MTPSPSKRRRSPVRGTDPWKDQAGISFSHWDLWYLVCLVVDHAGSWEALEAPFVEVLDQRLAGFEREDAESKLNHAADLRVRLDRVGLSPSDLLDDVVHDRRVVRRARSMLRERSAVEAYPTRPMVDTPRRLLAERASRGRWATFPVSPAMFDAPFMEVVEEKSHYPYRETVGLVQRLQDTRDRLVAEHIGTVAMLLAVTRAQLVALRECMWRVDDSWGEVGRALEDTIVAYCAIAWRETGMDPADYYRDLLELAVWEQSGVPWRHGLRSVFERLEDAEVELAEKIFRELREELVEARLDFQAERPLTLLGAMHVVRGNFERFPDLASEMGAREWERIVKMAQAAWRAGETGVALHVFHAADQPGRGRDYIARRCLELTGLELASEPPHLRLLD